MTAVMAILACKLWPISENDEGLFHYKIRSVKDYLGEGEKGRWLERS